MDRRMLKMILTMSAILISLLAGAALAFALFETSAETRQHLRELPWYTGPLAGVVGALVLGAIGVPIVRRRRRERGAT